MESPTRRPGRARRSRRNPASGTAAPPCRTSADVCRFSYRRLYALTSTTVIEDCAGHGRPQDVAADRAGARRDVLRPGGTRAVAAARHRGLLEGLRHLARGAARTGGPGARDGVVLRL